jgi:4-diphosphocytidyl-2-C-methyl-D-erythritol kinase
MLTCKAPAKINLGLAVERKRHDGYHDISTIFLKISLADTLTFVPTGSAIVVHCDHPDVPGDARNLVYRAAAALQPLAGGRGVQIELQKTIPIAAGLGGGSSDAAATLLACNLLWELGLSRAALLRYGRQLGADVAFFLGTDTAALGQGRGDELQPVACVADFALVLVKPPLAVSTAWTYSQLRLGLTGLPNNTNMVKQHLETGDIASLGRALFNDLEAVVLSRFPVVQTIKHALLRPGVEGVCMSGSGPTVFALCPSLAVAQEVARAVQQRAWDVWVCQPWQEAATDLEAGTTGTRE